MWYSTTGICFEERSALHMKRCSSGGMLPKLPDLTGFLKSHSTHTFPPTHPLFLSLTVRILVVGPQCQHTPQERPDFTAVPKYPEQFHTHEHAFQTRNMMMRLPVRLSSFLAYHLKVYCKKMVHECFQSVFDHHQVDLYWVFNYYVSTECSSKMKNFFVLNSVFATCVRVQFCVWPYLHVLR